MISSLGNVSLQVEIHHICERLSHVGHSVSSMPLLIFNCCDCTGMVFCALLFDKYLDLLNMFSKATVFRRHYLYVGWLLEYGKQFLIVRPCTKKYGCEHVTIGRLIRTDLRLIVKVIESALNLNHEVAY